MKITLLLSVFGGLWAMNLLDRCRLYNINPKHCQNSIYVPNVYYDNYLKSFNMPIQKDPECNTKNCLIVVYKEPPRIAVNSTGATSNFCENGFGLQNFSVCMPNIQPNTAIQPPIPMTVLTSKLLIQTVTVTIDSEKHSTTNTEHEPSPETIQKTVTTSIYITHSKETDTNHEKSSSKTSTDESTESEKIEHTKTITKEITKTVKKTKTEENENSSTTECKTETEEQCSKKEKTVTVTKSNGVTEENMVKTVTVVPSIQTPEKTENSVAAQTVIHVTSQITNQSTVSTGTNVPNTQESQLSINLPDIEKIKTFLRDTKKLCKINMNGGGTCEDCDDISCLHEMRKWKKKSTGNTDDTETSDSGDDKTDKSKDKDKDKYKKQSSKDTEKFITLFRYKTSTITSEIPITLYRELLKTVEKEKPLTKYKITTLSSTITKTITEEKTKTTTLTKEKSITLENEQSETITIHKTTTVENRNDGHTKKPNTSTSSADNTTESYKNIEKTVTKTLENIQTYSFTKIITTTVMMTDTYDQQKSTDTDVECSTSTITTKIKSITKNINENNELSDKLLPLFGRILERISKDTINHHDREKSTRYTLTTEKNTNIITVTQLETITTTKNIGYKQGIKTVVNTIYARTKPVKMKCLPLMLNSSNCVITQEGKVLKTIFTDDSKT